MVVVENQRWIQTIDGKDWWKPAHEAIEDAVQNLASELATEFGLCSDWIPPSGPNGEDDGLWLASEVDMARAIRSSVPAAAVVKYICDYFKIEYPEVVWRAFELGAEDLPWLTEGRFPGEARAHV